MEDTRQISTPRRTPWGFWATIGFSAAIGILAIFAQTMLAIPFLVAAKMLRPGFDIHSLGSNGLYLAVATLASAPLTIGSAWLFANLRQGMTIQEYFCLRRPGLRPCLKWAAVLLLLALCTDGLAVLLKRPIVPEFMVQVYGSAHFMPLLWLALVVGAPLAEETVFRGFLFTGFEHSRLGGTGAVLLTSVLWAALHIQYDWLGIGSVFAGGLLLGTARIQTLSLYVPLLLHMLWSLVATLETAIYMGRL